MGTRVVIGRGGPPRAIAQDGVAAPVRLVEGADDFYSLAALSNLSRPVVLNQTTDPARVLNLPFAELHVSAFLSTLTVHQNAYPFLFPYWGIQIFQGPSLFSHEESILFRVERPAMPSATWLLDVATIYEQFSHRMEAKRQLEQKAQAAFDRPERHLLSNFNFKLISVFDASVVMEAHHLVEEEYRRVVDEASFAYHRVIDEGITSLDEIEAILTPLMREAETLAHHIEILRGLIRSNPITTQWEATQRFQQLCHDCGNYLMVLRTVPATLPTLNELLPPDHLGQVFEILPQVASVYQEGTKVNLNLSHELLGIPLKGRTEGLALRDILTNLVSNAAKNTEGEDSRIDVSAQTTEKGLAITVSDYGRGMDDATLDRVYGHYNPHAGDTPGSLHGIGSSSLVQSIASSGGRMVVESQVGQGTSVRLLIPWGALVETENIPLTPYSVDRPPRGGLIFRTDTGQIQVGAYNGNRNRPGGRNIEAEYPAHAIGIPTRLDSEFSSLFSSPPSDSLWQVTSFDESGRVFLGGEKTLRRLDQGWYELEEAGKVTSTLIADEVPYPEIPLLHVDASGAADLWASVVGGKSFFWPLGAEDGFDPVGATSGFMFVIPGKSGPEITLIDPPSHTLEYFSEHHLPLESITQVLITHGHPDHFGTAVGDLAHEGLKPKLVTTPTVYEEISEQYYVAIGDEAFAEWEFVSIAPQTPFRLGESPLGNFDLEFEYNLHPLATVGFEVYQHAETGPKNLVLSFGGDTYAGLDLLVRLEAIREGGGTPPMTPDRAFRILRQYFLIPLTQSLTPEVIVDLYTREDSPLIIPEFYRAPLLAYLQTQADQLAVGSNPHFLIEGGIPEIHTDPEGTAQLLRFLNTHGINTASVQAYHLSEKRAAAVGLRKLTSGTRGVLDLTGNARTEQPASARGGISSVLFASIALAFAPVSGDLGGDVANRDLGIDLAPLEGVLPDTLMSLPSQDLIITGRIAVQKSGEPDWMADLDDTQRYLALWSHGMAVEGEAVGIFVDPEDLYVELVGSDDLGHPKLVVGRTNPALARSLEKVRIV